MNARFCLLLICAAALSACVEPEPMPTKGEAPVASGNIMEKPMAPTSDNNVQLAASIVRPAVADLANRLGGREDDITVRRAAAVVWNDGAAGCPQPGMMYTQAMVPGYWVVLEHDGQLYSYHAARSFGFKLCDGASVNPAGAPPHGRLNDEV